MKTIKIIYIAAILCLFASFAFAFQATFTPRISVNEEYTDNLFLSDKNKEHDYITTVSPGFTAELLGKNRGASISYDPGYTFYDRYSEKDTWRHNARFAGWADLTKNTRLDVSDSFLRTEDPLADADIVALRVEDATAQIDNTVRTSRQTYYTNSARINLTHKFREKNSFNLGYTHYILENDDETIEDKESHSPSTGFIYWFSPHWGFDADISYTNAEFDTSDDYDNWKGTLKLLKKISRQLEGFAGYTHTTINHKGNTEDYQTYNPFIGVTYSVAKDTSLSFDVGYFIHDNKNSGSDSGLTSNLDLGIVRKRCSINLMGTSGYEESSSGAENLGYNEFYEAGGSASYEITKHLSGNIFGSFRDNKYKALVAAREDKTTRCGLGLTIKPFKWMNVGISYTYRSVNSTLDANDYEENRGLITLTLIPSIPFRFAK